MLRSSCSLLISAGLFVFCSLATPVYAGDQPWPGKGWDFKMKDFVIGAWWGPGPTDAEVKLYKQAGFNVVMCGRYMELNSYGDPKKIPHEFELAQKYGLGVMFDTYTKNDRPWGGKAGHYKPHPIHHPATLIELKWLYERIGKHPALVGFMLGDDQGDVSPRAQACMNFLQKNAPYLMPWLCGWISPKNLARHNNPIVNPQIYPTLYEWGLPADELARRYCRAYNSFGRQCQDLGLLFWPMFNVAAARKDPKSSFAYMPTDSLTRFPAYLAIAYGAQGIWYFTYNGGAIQKPGTYRSEEEVRKALSPLYPIVKKINHRIDAWGPMVMRRRNPGLFGTVWPGKDLQPFVEKKQRVTPEGLAEPGKGKLVEAMSNNLIAGVLTRKGANPLVMIVDCRVSKKFGDIPPREVTLRFSPMVHSVRIHEAGKGKAQKGNRVSFEIESGGGQLLELEGEGLNGLTSREAIYASVTNAKECRIVERPLSEADLKNIRAARLRIDVFGSNGEAAYRRKTIILNGRSLARVPANNRDAWDVCVLDVPKKMLKDLKLKNSVTIRNRTKDAWKFRNLQLAVRLTDGSWVLSNIMAKTFSSRNWAHSEGTPFPESQEIGPFELAFLPTK